MICKMLHKYSNPKHKLFFSRLLMEVYAHNKTMYFLAHKWPVLASLWMAWCRINLHVGAQNQAVATLARQCHCFHCTQQQRTIFSDDNGSHRVHCIYQPKGWALKKSKINAFHNLYCFSIQDFWTHFSWSLDAYFQMKSTGHTDENHPVRLLLRVANYLCVAAF